MTRTEPQITSVDLQDTLDQIVAKFGAWRVSFAMIARIFTRRRQRLRINEPASDYLRRDVGLPPLSTAHLYAQARYGQMYF